MGLLTLVEIADVIGGEIFRSGYSIMEVDIVVVHRLTAGVIKAASLVVVAGIDG